MKTKGKRMTRILSRFSHSTVYFEEFWPTIKKKIQQKHLIQEFKTEDGGCMFFCLEHVFLTARGYEDVTYLPGRMLLFTGDQLHSVSPYKNPISSDRRIVLQGHGIFQNNQWWLFG